MSTTPDPDWEWRTGLLHDQVTRESRGLTGRCGHDCFEFDGGQPAERGLAATTVVGAFDPGDDGDAQLSRVSQRRRFRTFFCSRLKKLSMAALSPADRPGPWSRPCRGGPGRGGTS